MDQYHEIKNTVIALNKQGLYEEAEPYIDQALTLSPKDFGMMCDKASVFYHKKDYVTAMNWYKAAIDAGANFILPYYRYINCKIRLNIPLYSDDVPIIIFIEENGDITGIKRLLIFDYYKETKDSRLDGIIEKLKQMKSEDIIMTLDYPENLEYIEQLKISENRKTVLYCKQLAMVGKTEDLFEYLEGKIALYPAEAYLYKLYARYQLEYNNPKAAIEMLEKYVLENPKTKYLVQEEAITAYCDNSENDKALQIIETIVNYLSLKTEEQKLKLFYLYSLLAKFYKRLGMEEESEVNYALANDYNTKYKLLRKAFKKERTIK